VAQSLQDIIQSLDAGYAPSRQLINQQIDALPAQEQAQQAGLDATQKNAFDQITNGARDRGIGFSGIPLGEQAQYTASTYLPAVANLKTGMAGQKTSLLDALNQSGLAEQNAALGIQQNQQQMDFQREQAAAAQRASAASSQQLASLFGGGGQAPAAPADPYAAIDKQNATNAIVGLLKTNNAATVAKTIAAIGASARNGNIYDQYKLALLKQYQNGSPYAGLINGAISGPSVAAGIL
jgi:hypothetical protein